MGASPVGSSPVFFVCWRNEIERGRAKDSNPKGGAGKVVDRNKRRRSAVKKFSCAGSERRRSVVACVLVPGPYTPKDSKQKRKAAARPPPDSPKANQARSRPRSGRPVLGCERASTQESLKPAAAHPHTHGAVKTVFLQGDSCSRSHGLVPSGAEASRAGFHWVRERETQTRWRVRALSASKDLDCR